MNRSLVAMRLLAVCLALVATASAFNRMTLLHNANTTSINKAIPTLAPMSEFQKGIVYASWWHEEYSSPASDSVLSHSILPLGVNWISIVVTCYQQNINSTQIQCKPESSTPTDNDLTHVIQYAHSLGLRVMLKPHIDLADDPGHWRGQISSARDEAAWRTWFASYAQFITHFAKIAQDTNTDYLVIGTELAMTTHRGDDWRNIIKTVRKTYNGKLTYAAHHFDEEFTIDWWDAVDAIGIDAYYPLTRSKNPTLAQLKAAWRPIVAQLEKLSDRWNRPVILTEVGYQSLAGTSASPCCAKGNTIAHEEQANNYHAVFEAFQGRKWWQGVFWWVWTVNSSRISSVNDDFTACGKPAENVLISHYGGQPHPASTHPPARIAAQKEQLLIYDDALKANWKDWSWNAIAKPVTEMPARNKKNALKVIMNPWGALSLRHPGIDTSPYTWLEFYIFVGRDTQQKFTVSFNDQTDRPLSHNINLPSPRYVTEGEFSPGRWQKVRIPLTEMDSSNKIITRLNIKDDTGKCQREFYIDQIRLVGNVSDTGK